jgi:hypothetical protein
MSVRKIIATYPILFGVLIGLLIFGAAIAVASVPWLDEALEKHKQLIQFVWFTAVLFAFSVFRLWRWRRRGAFAFWGSISLFFFFHMLGVFLYTSHVQSLVVWRWIILLALECYAVVFFVDWSTKRFRHFGRHGSSRLNSNQDPREEDSA